MRSRRSISGPGRPLALVAAAFASACSAADDAPDAPRAEVRDSAGVQVVTITGDPDALPVWRLDSVPSWEISGDAEPFLGTVGEVATLSGGRLAVMDDQTEELRIFAPDGTGELLGGAGDGPGEFRYVRALTALEGDTLVAFDSRAGRFTIFGPDGALLRVIPVARSGAALGTAALEGWAFDTDRLVLHRMSAYDTLDATPRPRRDQRDVVLTLLDGSGTPTDVQLRFTGGYSVDLETGDARAPFANRPSVDARGDALVHTSGVDWELTLSGPDLTPRRIVRWEGRRAPLTPEAVAEVRAVLEDEFAEARSARPDLIDPLLEGLFSPRTLPDSLPALGRVVWATSGELWVSAFRSTAFLRDGEDEWVVLSGGGEPLARVTLPDRARLVAAGDREVVLVVRDDLDVEHVRVHRITGL